MMEAIKERNDEILSLGLALGCHSERRTKRKRQEQVVPRIISGEISKNELKLVKLIQERERMLSTPKQRGKTVISQGKRGLHIIHLLLVSATLINDGNITAAIDNLTELYCSVSVNGDSGQRVAAYFTDALTARILTSRSPYFKNLMIKPTPEEAFSGYTNLYRVSPFYQFAHFTANQTILEAFETELERNESSSLHVIDFDVSYGFQWPSLMQSLSDMATRLSRMLYFRITGYAKSNEELVETENRLVSFSRSFQSLEFEFQGALRGSRLKNPRKNPNETVVVNSVFHLSSLVDILNISETLSSIKSINPSIVVLVEREGSRNINCGFLSNYVDSLHYYAAIFDSLDDCLPLESIERLSIEKNHLGKEIKEAIGWGSERVNYSKFEKSDTWKARMESHCFSSVELSSRVVIQAKLLLKMGSHYRPHFEGDPVGVGAGFRVFERADGTAISLGWQDRFLLTASAWRPTRQLR